MVIRMMRRERDGATYTFRTMEAGDIVVAKDRIRIELGTKTDRILLRLGKPPIVDEVILIARDKQALDVYFATQLVDPPPAFYALP